MQEEVENRTVNLAVSTTKLSARTIITGLRWLSMHHNNKKLRKAMEARNGVVGEQTVADLMKTGDGIETIELANGSLKDFCKIAKDYGIDYAIRKDKTVDPPRYTVFFKAKNQEVMNEVIKEYSAKYEKKQEREEPEKATKKKAKEKAAEKRPSILAQLRKYKEECAKKPKKEHHKHQEKTR